MAKFIGMYIAALTLAVKKDLDNNPEIETGLGSFKARFINWCAKERVIYEADINDEYLEFKEKFIDSRLYNVDVQLWKNMRHDVFVRDKFTCQYCEKVGGSLEVDHIVPVSKGGTNDMSNLRTSCRKCNRQKRNKSEEEFRKWSESNGS